MTEARSKLPQPPSPEEDRAVRRQFLLEKVRRLYAEHGPKALTKAFLSERGLYNALLGLGIKRPVLLAELGVAVSSEEWNREHRFYRGQYKPAWSWEQVVKFASKVAEEHDGDLPTLEWFRKNHGGLANAIFYLGRKFEDLRSEVGSFKTSPFIQSRSGLRWRSQPECCLSDFLYARGIQHERGKGYEALNPEHVGRNKYDLHFLTPIGKRIDVEIWGNLDGLSEGRYAKTREKKESWRKGDLFFLGIESIDCLVEDRLEAILAPYIGHIAPYVFDKPTDRLIETAHWSSSDELIESCRQLSKMQPDGLFPNEQWLRKRGRYADRPGESYNTMAVRINQWLGGTRKVREILGQSHASSNEWTPESVAAAWQAFTKEHHITPSQAHSKKRIENLPLDVSREASRIYEAARRLGVLKQVRAGTTSRKIKWTPETVEQAWKEFIDKYEKLPTQCMSIAQRKALPKEVADEAANIYGAARRLNLVEKLRGDT